jgi:hypothetical protein
VVRRGCHLKVRDCYLTNGIGPVRLCDRIACAWPSNQHSRVHETQAEPRPN